MCESYKKADKSFNVYGVLNKKAVPKDTTANGTGKL
jgi:hypothetical protein